MVLPDLDHLLYIWMFHHSINEVETGIGFNPLIPEGKNRWINEYTKPWPYDHYSTILSFCLSFFRRQIVLLAAMESLDNTDLEENRRFGGGGVMSEELSKEVSKRLSIFLSLTLVKLYAHVPPKLFCCILLKLVFFFFFFSQDGS